MTDTEADIQNRIRIAASKAGHRLFRNNTGVLPDARGIPVRFGLCPGSSDLIGWVSLTVKPSDVGKVIAVFAAVEVKRPGKRPTDQQQAFIDAVRQAGGIGAVATSAGDLERILKILES